MGFQAAGYHARLRRRALGDASRRQSSGSAGGRIRVSSAGNGDDARGCRKWSFLFLNVPLRTKRRKGKDFAASKKLVTADDGPSPAGDGHSRPDVLHECLMTLLDSPMNKEGLLDEIVVFAERQDAAAPLVFRVSPGFRIPRTWKVFSKVFCAFLKDSSGCLKAEGDGSALLEMLSAEDAAAYLRKPRVSVGAFVGCYATPLRKPQLIVREATTIAFDFAQRFDADTLQSSDSLSRIAAHSPCYAITVRDLHMAVVASRVCNAIEAEVERCPGDARVPQTA